MCEYLLNQTQYCSLVLAASHHSAVLVQMILTESGLSVNLSLFTRPNKLNMQTYPTSHPTPYSSLNFAKTTIYTRSTMLGVDTGV